MAALSIGDRLLDQRTREFIHTRLSYRVALTESGADARALETLVRRDGLAEAGRPLIKSVTSSAPSETLVTPGGNPE